MLRRHLQKINIHSEIMHETYFFLGDPNRTQPPTRIGGSSRNIMLRRYPKRRHSCTNNTRTVLFSGRSKQNTTTHVNERLIAFLGIFGSATFAAALVPVVAIGFNWRRATPLAGRAITETPHSGRVSFPFVGLSFPVHLRGRTSSWVRPP